MLVCSVFGLSYSTTHRVVPANQRWVVVNTLKGEVQGGVRKSGITKMPLIRDIYKYPGAQEQPFCIQYTPALKVGFLHFIGERTCKSLFSRVILRWYNYIYVINFMEIKIKDSVSCINGKWDEDYTYIFDAESKSHIFICNALLKELRYENLEEKEEKIFLQITNALDYGTFHEEHLKKSIFIRTEEEFRDNLCKNL